MSLYNTLRPQTLSEVVGQENVKAQVRGITESELIPNALCLIGPRGTGKTTIARIVAKMLNCESGESEPCGECRSCKAILNGTSMDVIELDAASNNKVEDVRNIVEKAQYAPMSKYKIFILDEVHMFSQGAWNALLKTIEEPPKNVIFMLCTTEEHKVPATIMSRCRKLYFEKIELSTVADYLASVCENAGKAYDMDALKLIAQASEGCMRDALSIMEPFYDSDTLITDIVANTLGAAQEEAIFGILNAISDGNASLAVQIVREQAQKGKNAQLLVKGLIGAVTDTMFVLNGSDIDSILSTKAYKEQLATYKDKASMEKCLELSKALSEVYGAITKVPDALFLIESSLLRVVDYESRLSKLERRLAAIESGVVSVKTTENTATTNVVSFPQQEIVEEKAVEIAEPVAVGNEQAKVIIDESLQDFIHNIPIPVDEEEFSDMDLSDIPPFECGITEDEIPSGFFNAPSEPTPQTVSETPKEILTAVQTPTNPEPSPVVKDNGGFVDIEDEGFDDLLSHLPQGTNVAGKVNVPTKAPKKATPAPQKEKTTNVTKPETKTSSTVGETEPIVKVNDELPPIGIAGFSDWL